MDFPTPHNGGTQSDPEEDNEGVDGREEAAGSLGLFLRLPPAPPGEAANQGKGLLAESGCPGAASCPRSGISGPRGQFPGSGQLGAKPAHISAL